MNLGKAIKRLREARGLSQGDVERSTGIVRCYVSRVENNKTLPALPQIQRIAGAMGLKAWEVVREAEEAQ